MSHDDFDFDPVKGLPAHLPEGERMLWQGSPRWQDMALHAFHARKVAVYFAVLTFVTVAYRLMEGDAALTALRPVIWYIPMALVAVGLLTGLAWASARTTIYTITTRRIVLRIGIALPISLNLPFAQIESAGLRLYPSAAGDIPVGVKKGERLAWLILWPHVRPFKLNHPEPMLRAVPDAQAVAAVLGAALAGKEPAALPVERKTVRLSPQIVTA
jgi:Bacterial PH domain